MNPPRDSDGVRVLDAGADLRVSFAEGRDHAAAVERATAILRREGVVVLDDLVDPALLEACRQEIVARYPDYDQRDVERDLGSFPGRYTMPLVIDGLLAKRAIFAPRAIREIGRNLLSAENILESLGLLVSLPGSPDQGQHFDGLLFTEGKLDRVLPPVALSISMPLVPLDEANGTTAFWRRSHRENFAGGPPDFAPAMPVGSVVMWDFRTIHSGRGNRSDAPRPILFSVHSRDWWQEPKRAKAVRYKKLQVARAVYDGFGPPMRDFICRADIID
ncbi:MAG: hypothetical protein E7773_02215 [Sphingomonas sp.]|uniref:phytanoyl-CoA dioxygenase family protein n=1 Tax=Sphingomonas sp. TaxID=28214 RepID=UPI001217A556|nr:phytanoyl-CoA dioxygenase family protein [Sphingomonas sp.]THD37814.1 MAG: hypothetical protein E7773_02215 [Sphingomonas sp.]